MTVLLLAVLLSRWVITGASSATAAPPPCCTVCPPASTVMTTEPSSMYQFAARAVMGEPAVSSSARNTDKNRFIFTLVFLLNFILF